MTGLSGSEVLPPADAPVVAMDTETEGAQRRRSDGSARVVLACLIVFFAVVLIRNAFLVEDAYITFRTVDNFVHGRGLTWNPGERVQVYTHPLWMFAVSLIYGFTRELPFSVTALSLALSVLTLLIVARMARTLEQAILAIAVVTLSKAYMDYSSSGLENPMTHALLALFLFVYLRPGRRDRRRLTELTLLTALAGFNRLDTVLLCLPCLAVAYRDARGAGERLRALVGLAPLVAWEAFSLFYYGSPFPNTAYAKLGSGVPAGELIHQGVLYLVHSLSLDPLTLVAISVAVLGVAVLRRRPEYPVALGLLLYLAYVVKVGGCFMSGRFLTPALAGAAILLASLPLERSAVLAIGAAVLVLGLGNPRSPVLSDAEYGSSAPTAIAYDAKLDNRIFDERGTYYASTGLLRAGRFLDMPTNAWALEGRAAHARGAAIVERYNCGYFGFYAGPEVHVIEKNGLTDPLLARMPALQSPTWLIGHFERAIPAGYVESLRSGEAKLEDPKLAELYRHLRLITHGPLLSTERLAAILRLNFGLDGGLVDHDRYRHAALVHATLRDVGADARQSELAFEGYGVEIQLGGPRPVRTVELSVSGEAPLGVTFVAGGRETPVETLYAPLRTQHDGSGVYVARVPESFAGVEPSAVRIYPLRRFGTPYQLRYLLVRGDPDRLEASFQAARNASIANHQNEVLTLLAPVHADAGSYDISRFLTGWAHHSLGHKEDALRDYRLATRFRPDYAQTWANLGFLLQEMGQFSEAADAFEVFLKYDPDNAGVRRHLEDCRRMAGAAPPSAAPPSVVGR